MRYLPLATSLLIACSVHGATVYTNDFTGAGTPGTDFLGVTSTETTTGAGWTQEIVHTTPYAGITHTFHDATTNGVSGQWLQSNSGLGNTATFVLNNLPTHDKLNLDLFLAAGGGIDGNNTADSFEILVDGVSIFNETFGNRTSRPQTVSPALLIAGNQATNNTDGIDFLDQRTGGWGHDMLYDLGLDAALQNINHTSSTATIQLISSFNGESGSDEQLAFANLVVSIPEPSRAVLISLGIALFGLRRRR